MVQKIAHETIFHHYGDYRLDPTIMINQSEIIDSNFFLGMIYIPIK